MTVIEMGPATIAHFPKEMGSAGATGCLMRSDGYTPSKEGNLIYFHVEDVEET
jgi:predicted enzyme related to lactoylglutathione lyase